MVACLTNPPCLARAAGPPAPAGKGAKQGAAAPPRRPKTDEEWLAEVRGGRVPPLASSLLNAQPVCQAMSKVGQAMNRANANGETAKVREYSESLATLQKLHDRSLVASLRAEPPSHRLLVCRLTNSPPAQQQQVRNELAAIRRSFN